MFTHDTSLPWVFHYCTSKQVHMWLDFRKRTLWWSEQLFPSQSLHWKKKPLTAASDRYWFALTWTKLTLPKLLLYNLKQTEIPCTTSIVCLHKESYHYDSEDEKSLFLTSLLLYGRNPWQQLVTGTDRPRWRHQGTQVIWGDKFS